MNILYVDPEADPRKQQKYIYYCGLPMALANIGANVQLVPGFSSNEIDFINDKFDCVIYGLGRFNKSTYPDHSLAKSTKLAYAFKPQNNLEQKLRFCELSRLDCVYSSVPLVVDLVSRRGVHSKILPYGHFDNIFYDRKLDKRYAVGFSGALHNHDLYPQGAFANPSIRSKIRKVVSELVSTEQVFWNGSDSVSDRIGSYEEYASTIGRSKAWLATLAAFGDVTPRYFEVLASGTVLLAEQPGSGYEDIFRDGDNCLLFKSDLSDFEEKLSIVLNNPDKVASIIESANKDVKLHTWSSRADSVIEFLESGRSIR
jgi:glycosyltransferase involved in cell wall biosynthesis